MKGAVRRSIKKFYELALLLLFCCIGVSCIPTAKVVPFTVDAAGSAKLQKGIVFYLPKNVLEVSITYTEFEKKVWQADAHGAIIKKDAKNRAVPPVVSQCASVVEPIKIKLKTIADRRMGFLLDTQPLDGIFFDTKLTVETTADGRLKAVNHSASDKSAEVAAQGAQAVLQLVKIAAVAGETVTELKKIRDIDVVRLIDPADLSFERKGELFEAVYSDKEEIKQLLPASTTPDDIKIKFTCDSDLGALSKISTADLKLDGERFSQLRGIPYRVARPVVVTASSDNFEQMTHRVLYRDHLSFVQAGGVAYVPVKGSMFSSSSSGLELYDQEGSLKKYSFSDTSSAETVSQAAQGISADAAKQLEDLNGKELELRLARLKKQRDILETEQEIRDAEPGSLKSRTERLKQFKAFIDAELAAAEAAGK